MALELRANTAVDVLIGPFVDDGDGDTADTDATLVVELSKNGQALATKNEGTNPSHDAAGTVDGYYNCQLDTTDTNTEGNMVLVVHHADDLPVRHEYSVLAEAAWDSKYVAKDDGFMDVNIKTVGRADTQETEANNLESACSNYSVTRGLTGTAVPAAAADAAGGLVTSDDGGWDADELYDAIVTDAAGANIAVDIIAVKAETADIVADTNELQGDWANAGRLDAILDIIAADTTTDIPATITTMQGNVTDILADTNELQADDTPTAISGLDSKIDTIDTNVDQIETAVITNAAGTDIAADIIAVKAETATIVADTNELQTDNTPGALSTIEGKIDTIDTNVDSVLTDTGTTLDGKINTIDTNVDSILEDTDGTDGVAIAAGGIAAAQFAAGAIDAAALNADAVTEFWAKVVEDDDAANYTAKDVLSIVLAVLAGVTATDGSVIKTPDGTTTRVTATINASQERTAMTLVPSN